MTIITTSNEIVRLLTSLSFVSFTRPHRPRVPLPLQQQRADEVNCFRRANHAPRGFGSLFLRTQRSKKAETL